MKDTEFLPCNRCGSKTTHSLRFHAETTESSELVGHEDIVAAHGYGHWLYECQGCKHIQLGKCLWSTELDPLPWPTSTEWFPHRVLRPTPPWFKNLPDVYRVIVEEIYASVNSGLGILPLIGVRTAIDLFIRTGVGDQASFKAGLASLQRIGTLSALQVEQLGPVVEAGHAAAHRGFEPTQSQILTALDVLEHLLKPLILATSLSQLKAAIPPRPRQ